MFKPKITDIATPMKLLDDKTSSIYIYFVFDFDIYILTVTIYYYYLF